MLVVFIDGVFLYFINKKRDDAEINKIKDENLKTNYRKG